MPSKAQRLKKQAEARRERLLRIGVELDRLELLKKQEGGLFMVPENGGARLWVPTELKTFLLSTIQGEYKAERAELLALMGDEGIEVGL